VSLANIVLYIAILGFIVYRRVQAKPFESARKLFILPVVVTVIGYEDLTHASLHALDIGFVAAGCVISLVLGAFRGSLNKITSRNGTPWVRWGTASVIVFAVNIAAKLILDVVSVVAGGTSSGTTSSLVLAAGLMLAGEAAVIWLRLQVSPPAAVGGQSTSSPAFEASEPFRVPQPSSPSEPIQPRTRPRAEDGPTARQQGGSAARDGAARTLGSLLRRRAYGWTGN
jgi:hypothetical protein